MPTGRTAGRDLAFSVEETRSLLAGFGVLLDEPELALVHRRSEGSVAGFKWLRSRSRVRLITPPRLAAASGNRSWSQSLAARTIVTSLAVMSTVTWLAGRLGRRRIGPGRYPADAGTKRVVQGALVDVRRVADENDGPAGVLVVAAGITARRPAVVLPADRSAAERRRRRGLPPRTPSGCAEAWTRHALLARRSHLVKAMRRCLPRREKRGLQASLTCRR